MNKAVDGGARAGGAERLEPTRALAFRVWWAFIWRTILGAIASGFVVGLCLGMLSKVFELESRTVENLSAFFGLVIGLGVSVEVMYRILRKRFAQFEIVLAPRRQP